MKLILDENLPPRWCEYLAPFGITASHWRDLRNIGDPDEVILYPPFSLHAAGDKWARS